jgi:hypothetical protein
LQQLFWREPLSSSVLQWERRVPLATSVITTPGAPADSIF